MQTKVDGPPAGGASSSEESQSEGRNFRRPPAHLRKRFSGIELERMDKQVQVLLSFALDSARHQNLEGWVDVLEDALHHGT